jgi:hypothetical protein
VISVLDQSRTRIHVLALRVAADLLEFAISGEADEEMMVLNLLHDEPTLHEAVFDTADDQDHLDLDLFEPSVFVALVNEVKTLLARAEAPAQESAR